MSENSSDTRRKVDAPWIAAAAVVVLVAAGLVWILMRHNDSTPASPAPSGSATVTSSVASGSVPRPSAAVTSSATTAATASAWPDSGCNGSAAPPVAPQSAMTDLRWEPFLSSAIPMSPTIGPAKTSGALRQCFQHSPAGALVAAANIALGQFVPGTGRTVVETQFVAGPGRDKALKDLATSSGQPGQIVAFKLNGCTAAACNVDLVFFGRGAYGSAVVPMVWTNGDWYVDGSQRIPDGGLVQGIPAGFTAWGST